MKKLALLFIALVTTGFALRAQYAPGDMIEKDGLQAIVISVNEDGSHGLCLYSAGRVGPTATKTYSKSQRKMQENHMKKFAKTHSTLVEKMENESTMSQELGSINWALFTNEKYADDVYNRLTTSGKNNMTAIEEYCSANDLDMASAFPQFAWAKSLGDSWFLPSEDESTLYSVILGKSEKVTGIFKSRDYAYNTDLYERLTAQGYEGSVPDLIMSSKWQLAKKKSPKYEIECYGLNMQTKGQFVTQSSWGIYLKDWIQYKCKKNGELTWGSKYSFESSFNLVAVSEF